MVGTASEILEFVRVFFVIVEFEAVRAFVPFGVAPALGAYAAAHDLSGKAVVGGAEDLGDSGVIPFLRGIVEQRTKCAAIECCWQRK